MENKEIKNAKNFDELLFKNIVSMYPDDDVGRCRIGFSFFCQV